MATPIETHFDFPASPDDRGNRSKRQQALVAMGRRAVAAPAPAVLVEDAAALLADALEMEYWLVAVAGEVGGEVDLQLSLGSPGGGDQEIVLKQTTPPGAASLAAFALSVGYPVTVDDFTCETRFRDTVLGRSGIRSAVAVPLRLSQRPFRVLAACSKRPQSFAADDLLFAETIAHLVTSVVVRSQAEQALAEQRRLTTGLLQTLDAIVMVLDRDGRIVQANRTCERLTGFGLEEIRKRPIQDILPASAQTDLFSSIFEELRRGRGPVRYESYLLTKHSEQRQIAWSYNILPEGDGAPETILATGIDVTDQRQAEEKARCAVQAAERPLQSASMDSSKGLAPQNHSPEHASAAAQSALLNDERRGRQRRSYPYRQSIAPMLNGQLPDPAAFYLVQCNDIASGGFSYLAAKPPQSDAIIVALGAPPSLTYLHAQIAHVTRIRRDGQWMYLVGCSYTGRVFY